MKVSHRKGYLGLCDDTAGARQLLVRAEAASGAPEELASARVLTQLGHGDAAEGKRRRVVAQADAFEGAEHVANDEGARRGGYQGVQLSSEELVLGQRHHTRGTVDHGVAQCRRLDEDVVGVEARRRDFCPVEGIVA